MVQDNDREGRKFANGPPISRRQFLATGSFVGAGLTSSTSVVLGDTVGNVRIVTKRQQGDTHTTRKVPKKWRRHILRSRQAYESTVDRLSKKYPELEFSRKAADSEIHGLNKVHIEVAVPEEKPEIKKKVPDEVDGIRVRTATKRESVLTSDGESHGCYNDRERRSVPGGSPCHSSKDGNMGFQAHVGGDSQYMMTAFHIVHSWGCDATNTLEYYDNRIGEVYAYDAVADWALVSKDYYDVDNISGNIVNTDDGSMWFVDSYFTESGLEYCLSNDTILNKQGRVHGNLTGEIESLNDSISSGCADMGGSGVGSRIWQSPGESGCPVYQQYDGTYATVAHIGSYGSKLNYYGSADCNGAKEYHWTVGWPAYKIQGTSGIDIGAPRNSA